MHLKGLGINSHSTWNYGFKELIFGGEAGFLLLFLPFLVIFGWILRNCELALDLFAVNDVGQILDEGPGINSLHKLNEAKAARF